MDELTIETLARRLDRVERENYRSKSEVRVHANQIRHAGGAVIP